MQKVHFIGIGGVGMNGLAQLAAHSNYSVSGSDRAYNPQKTPFITLEKCGISIFPQDGSGIDASTTQVVYSTAIESDNPDLQKARQLKIPTLHRAAFLKQLVGNDALIAIAGTAGKTTTTGLLGWIFEALGKDPSVYTGAAVSNWKTDEVLGNVRKGKTPLWIIEADESDRSFLLFHPTHTIITNISKDHYELDELHAMFHQFEEQTEGIIIKNSVLPPLIKNSTYPSFIYKEVSFSIPMLGKHNMENAFCAIRLCDQLGFDLEKVSEALRKFKGIDRRLEQIGVSNNRTVFDDYAHNPAKISAALSAVSTHYNHVHTYWRPHGFTPLFQNAAELVEVFSRHWHAHKGSIFILPVYYAGGTVNKRMTSANLVQQLNDAQVPAKFVPDYAALKIELKKVAQAGDAILGMGARDPELPLFAKKLVTSWKK